MQSRFPIFQNHLGLAHIWWAYLLQPGDTVLDATCGNGHDVLFLAQHVLTDSSGWVWGVDIQKKALESTKERLQVNLRQSLVDRIGLLEASHEQLPKELQEERFKLVVYNLGYLPGGDKELTTLAETTIKSLETILPVVVPGGAISVTCYSGHPEGSREQQLVLQWGSCLPKDQWNVTLHQWMNRTAAPALLFIQKKID